MENVLIAARAVHYASTIALAGGFAFLCLVAGPAFRQATIDPAAAERLRRNLAWLSWASLALALASGAVWLLATASTMSGEPLRSLVSGAFCGWSSCKPGLGRSGCCVLAWCC